LSTRQAGLPITTSDCIRNSRIFTAWYGLTFAIIDGIIATNHGHYIAKSNVEECVVPMNCLIGGDDPLSVDVVAAAFLGFKLEEVKHLSLAAQTGTGEGNLDNISIVNRHLFDERKKDLTCELLDIFPSDLKILRGRERCCKEVAGETQKQWWKFFSAITTAEVISPSSWGRISTPKR